MRTGGSAAQSGQPPTIKVMSLDFPAYAMSPEHDALRESVRALAGDKIAPHAAKVDQTAEFPWEAHDALVKADLHAVHIPAAYGGAGADALAAVIVIEEVARACAASSLIPAVNKLGTVPLLLSASEELKQRYLPPVARGEAMFSCALSEPESGSDAAAGASGISAFVVESGDEGFSFGAPQRKLGIKGSPTRELYFDNCVIPADRMIG